MEKKINYGIIFSVFLAIVLIVGGFSYMNTVNDLKTNIDNKDSVIADKDNSLLTKDAEISNLAEQVVILNQQVIDASTIIEPTVVENVINYIGELFDRLISEIFVKTLTDRELDLIDGEVEFIDENGDEKDFNIDERVYIKDITATVNGEDFDADVYAIVLKDAIQYIVDFEDNLNISLIDSDNPLVFDFLGERIEVIDWNDGDVKFLSTNKLLVNEGESVTTNTSTITVEMVSSDKISVLITVNADSEVVKVGKSKTIGGIDVYVSDIFYRDNGNSRVYLYVGNDVMQTISDDEYEEDSIWSWIVNDDNKTIGLTLSEEFEDLDEENKPLAYGESICLPNDYVCVKFNELSDEEYSELKFEYDANDKELEIKGDFEIDDEDVDTLFINNTGMYYEDEDNKMQYMNTDLYGFFWDDYFLQYDNDTRIITIGTEDDNDLVIPMNLSKVEFVNFDNETKEGMYRSIYGSIIEIESDLDEDPEDDKEISILIPEEQIEVSFLVY